MPYQIREDETYRFGELKPSSQAEQAYYADAWRSNKYAVLSGSALKALDRKIKTLENLVTINPVQNGRSMFTPEKNYTFFRQSTDDDGAQKLDLLETWTAGNPTIPPGGIADDLQIVEGYSFNSNDPKDKARLARVNAEKRQLEDELRSMRQEDQIFKSKLLEQVQEDQKTMMGLMDRMLEERASAVRFEEEGKRHLADRMRLDQEVERERERAEKARAEGLADALNENSLGNKLLEGLPGVMDACGPAINALLMKVVAMIPDKGADDASASVTVPTPDPPPNVGFPAVNTPLTTNGVYNPS